VCKLHKALYGLKQVLPRAWFRRLSSFLLELGFTASLVDTSVFTLFSGLTLVHMLVYVDDIIITGPDNALISAVITWVQHEFPLKDLGPLHFFLGIQITRTKEGLHLCQAKYISDLLTRTHMESTKPARSPCSSRSKLSSFDGDPLPNPTKYKHIVGSLQYCTLTCLEISFSVNQLCQHLHAPTTAHLTDAKRVLHYLKSSIDKCIFFSKGSLQLSTYCDSDWARSSDDRKSTSSFAIFLGSNIIYWSAQKQPVVSRSSTEAEYRSLAIAIVELFWLRMLFHDIQVPLFSTPIILCDNISALALASNPLYHA
jgi:hypothetical protein